MAEKRRGGKGKTRVRRRDRKNIPRGRAYIQATFNNTIVTLTDPAGNVIAWSSAGANGFKGVGKSTPYAAQVTAEPAARKAMEHGLRQVDVFVKGPAPAARWRSARCNRVASRSSRSPTRPRFRTMAAGRRSGGASRSQGRDLAGPDPRCACGLV